jgi:hypothetical protein
MRQEKEEKKTLFAYLFYIEDDDSCRDKLSNADRPFIAPEIRSGHNLCTNSQA